MNEQMILTKIDSIADAVKGNKHEQSMASLAVSLEQLTKSMSTFEYQNQLLRTENANIKATSAALEEEIKAISCSNNLSTDAKELMKIKDSTIKNLHKEITELKNQRADTTREMAIIREQIAQLKAATKGENRFQRGGAEPRQALTLKFDNLNDKL